MPWFECLPNSFNSTHFRRIVFCVGMCVVSLGCDCSSSGGLISDSVSLIDVALIEVIGEVSEVTGTSVSFVKGGESVSSCARVSLVAPKGTRSAALWNLLKDAAELSNIKINFKNNKAVISTDSKGTLPAECRKEQSALSRRFQLFKKKEDNKHLQPKEVKEKNESQAVKKNGPKKKEDALSLKIQKISQNRYLIERDSVRENYLQLKKEGNRVSVKRASDDNGFTLGYQIISYPKGHVLKRLGIKKGDVLIKIGGHHIRSSYEALNVYTRVSKLRDFDAEIKRGNTKIVIEYKFKDRNGVNKKATP